jgi:N-acetylglucosamine-6-sulfatase
MAISRREILMGAAAAAAPAAESRPNFLFILIDDLRFDALHLTGHSFAQTPNIDRIGREGMIFRNAFVTTPLCSPSRASFLTGQYVHTHGILDNTERGETSHRLVTFPRLLRDAGYETAYIGKWHMGRDDTPRPGFDRWVSFPGQGQFIDPAMNLDGERIKASGYMTDLLTDHAVEFLRRKRDRPFCAYLAHKAVHGPFTPAERHKTLYSGETIRRAANAKDDRAGKPALRRVEDARQSGPSDEVILNQLRCLKSIDEGVGRLLNTLRDTGQLDNTLVLFTSDNGYFWGEHGLGDKRASYEEAIRIPMLARYPRLMKAGAEATAAALNIDIAPTFLELARVKAPAAIEGRSLVPVMRGNAKNWRRSFVVEYFEEKQFPRIAGYKCVRTERWKYTRFNELQGMDELYDLKADPQEMNNRINDPAAAGALREMKAELDRLLKKS